MATTGKVGFETAIPVNAGAKTFKVQALDANGRVLRTSRAFVVSG